MFNAKKISGMVRCFGGKPALVLRDQDQHRIAVTLGHNRVATIVSGAKFGIEQEAVLLGLGNACEQEWRGSLGDIAAGLSGLQQTGGDWDAALDAFFNSQELTEELGL